MSISVSLKLEREGYVNNRQDSYILTRSVYHEN